MKSLATEMRMHRQEIQRHRTKRLARGSVRGQHGPVRSRADWKTLKAGQSRRLNRISRLLKV